MKNICFHKNLQIIFSITLISIAGVSVVAPVLPKISEALRIPPEEIGLLITVFTLPGILFAPVLGALSDRWGRKTILIPALVLFGIAGTACSFAKTFEALLILRFFQGLGASALGVLNLTMIGDFYSGEERAEALGYNAGILSLGTAVYPAVGGFLALLGWNYPFAISILAIPVAVLVWFELDHIPSNSGTGTQRYWPSVIAILKSREVAGYLLATVASFVVIYGLCLTAYPLFMREVIGSSSVVIGLFLAMMSVGTAAASFSMKFACRRASFQKLIFIAFGLYAVLAVIFPFCDRLWMLVLPTVAFGFANGLNIPSIQTALSSAVPPQYRGLVLSLNGTLLRVGQTLGPLVVGLVLVWGDIRMAFYFMSGFALMSAAVMRLAVGGQKKGDDRARQPSPFLK